jgi:predicted transcriptional regulator of viral defense system
MSEIGYKFRRYVKLVWSERLEQAFQGATVLRSKDLEKRGLNRGQIREALNHGMERIGRGLYTRTNAEITEHHSLVQAAKRVPGGAICLLSALRFHDLTSQNSHEVWMAIGEKDRLPQQGNPPIKIVRFGKQQFDLGLETHEVEHAELRVYSVARTVVDLFRYRNKIGIDVALEALKEGWRERRFTMKEINQIAASCRMARVMKPYLESLTS